MALGGHNPLPEQLGGGLNKIERANAALKSSVGIGGSAVDGSIEAEWRFARASGLGSVMSFDERATWQAFPDTATDHIPIYEAILKINPPVGASDEERRQAILLRWLEDPDATHTAIELSLQEIDSRFSIFTPDHDDVRYTQGCRAFEEYLTGNAGNSVPFNLPPGPGTYQKDTAWPNYSDDFVLVVKFNISAAPTSYELLLMARAKAFLNRVLPSWVDFAFIFGPSGFNLDIDFLDLTGMTPS